jgi:protein-S-isoprenylcysteine O-methyltransferase Ste14
VFNYGNDRFYVMLPSQVCLVTVGAFQLFFSFFFKFSPPHTALRQPPQQLFFQATELVPCFFIYNLLDAATHKQLQPLVCVLGLAVACAHVLLALKERVLWGLFMSGINTGGHVLGGGGVTTRSWQHAGCACLKA